MDEGLGAPAAPPSAGFGRGGTVEDDLVPGIDEDEAFHGMIEGLLKHVNDRLAGVEVAHPLDSEGEMRVELFQESAFSGSEGSLEGGTVEFDKGDEAGIVDPEKKGCEMADAVGLHDVTVEGRGEKLRLGHLVVEEGRENAWVSV